MNFGIVFIYVVICYVLLKRNKVECCRYENYYDYINICGFNWYKLMWVEGMVYY